MKTAFAWITAVLLGAASMMSMAHSQAPDTRDDGDRYSGSHNQRANTNTQRSTNSAGEPVVRNCLVSLIEQVRIPVEEAGVVTKLHVKEGHRVWKYVSKSEAAKSGRTAEDIKRGRFPVVQIKDELPRRQYRVAHEELKKAKIEAANPVNIQFAEKSAAVSKTEYDQSVQANLRVSDTVPSIEVARLKLTWERSLLQIKQSLLERDLAEGTVKVKEEELAAAVDSIYRRRIMSPIDGEVTHLFVKEGEWVRAGDPVMRVINLERLRVEGFLDIHKHDPDTLENKTVSIEVPMTGNRIETFSGKVTMVHDEIQAGGVYRVWAEVENRRSPSGRFVLKPGLDATMTIHTKGPEVASSENRK